MKILVADKFERSGIEGLKAAGCEVAVSAGPAGRCAGAGDSRHTRRRPRRPRHRGERADARGRRAVAHRARGRRLQHDRRGDGIQTRHLRLELSRQERDRGRGARLRTDARARPAHRREHRGAARRHLEQEGIFESARTVWPHARSARIRQHRPGVRAARARVRHARRRLEPPLRRRRRSAAAAVSDHDREDAGGSRREKRRPQRPPRAHRRDARARQPDEFSTD